MSRGLMEVGDIPAYIKEILSGGFCFTTKPWENVVPGYTFRLYNGKWKIGYEEKLKGNAEKLVKWAARYYADARIVSEHFWYEEYHVENNGIFDPAASKRKARSAGFRNYIVVVITDPVARILEMAGLVKV